MSSAWGNTASPRLSFPRDRYSHGNAETPPRIYNENQSEFKANCTDDTISKQVHIPLRVSLQ